MKKIVFIDIDGTVYKAHEDSISESIKQKLKDVKDDVDLFISTGRGGMVITCLREAKEYFKGFVLSNGSVVIYNNQIISKKVVEKTDLIKFIEAAKELGCVVGLLTPDKVYVSHMNDLVDYALTPRDENSVIDINGYDFDLEKEYCMAWSFDDLELINKLEERLPDNFTFFKWGKTGSDIVLGGITKAKGILELFNHLDKANIKTYAIGDSGNDIPMFKLVDVSICMGNGTEAAKEAATHITKDLNDFGFEEAIDNIVKGVW